MTTGPMTLLLAWLFLAFVVERLVEVVLKVFPWFDKKRIVFVDVAMILALAFSLVIAFGANLDFFQMFGIEFAWPYVGPVVAAILMMGGSNLVHDIIKWVEASKDVTKQTAESVSARVPMFGVTSDEIPMNTSDEPPKSGVPPRA